MKDPLKSPRHSAVKKFLRIAGPLTAGCGLVLIVIGFGSFFMAFGGFEPPRYFWAAFAGMPLLFAGIVMCKFGYLGDVIRYVAAESAPVAKDTANYIAEETQDAVRTVARAVTEGIQEGQRTPPQAPNRPPVQKD